MLQLFGVASFIEVARTSAGSLEKLSVIGLVAIFIAMVIWASFRAISLRGSLLYLPALLATGYVVAFHVVGIMAFPGLLRDWKFSSNYFMSVFDVALVAFVLFVVTAILLLILKRAVSSYKSAHQK